MPLPPFDVIDRRLLELIQNDASLSLSEMGNAVGLSPSAVQRRLAHYKSSGLISSQITVLDPRVLPGTVLACVVATLERESTELHAEFQKRMFETPEVQQCYMLAGNLDYLVIIAANGMQRCRRLVDELFLDASNVKRFDTRVVFDAVKTGLRLAID